MHQYVSALSPVLDRVMGAYQRAPLRNAKSTVVQDRISKKELGSQVTWLPTGTQNLVARDAVAARACGWRCTIVTSMETSLHYRDIHGDNAALS